MPLEKFHDCIEVCQDCRVSCEHCASACLQEDDVALLAHCIELDRSCAAICSLTVGEMVRNTGWVAPVCRLCAEICEACAQECERHTSEHCKACAVVCRSCADECHQMAEATVAIGARA